jgi:hypothetical protein
MDLKTLLGISSVAAGAEAINYRALNLQSPSLLGRDFVIYP